MPNKLMSGFWRFMLDIPPALWQKQVNAHRAKIKADLGFMSPERRRVHHFVVRELPACGKPMPPEFIAQSLKMPLDQVISILDDLEKNLTFLFRDNAGQVVWAYPVTVEQTPHQITMSSGEQLYAAWAVDAFATPFVQGRLRDEALSIDLRTSCAHSGRPMHLTIDSEMNCQVHDDGCEPIIFAPKVDFKKLGEPSIIDSFWRNSVFFWSEENARSYRREQHRIPGAYFKAEQIAFLNRIVQSAMFGFDE